MAKSKVVCAIGSGLGVAALGALCVVSLFIVLALIAAILMSFGVPKPLWLPTWLDWCLTVIGTALLLIVGAAWAVEFYNRFYRRCRGLPAKASESQS